MIPTGFSLVKGWLPLSLETAVQNVTWEQPTFKMFGRTCLAPRMTAWFGDGAYTYSGKRHEPSPMPAWIDVVRRDLERLAQTTFNSVLLNYYRDGRDSVAWHADDESELGSEPTIASLSLGAPRTFAVKARQGGMRWGVQLGSGDLLIMSGRSQLDYLHSIPKTSQPVGPRINLTFRRVG